MAFDSWVCRFKLQMFFSMKLTSFSCRAWFIFSGLVDCASSSALCCAFKFSIYLKNWSAVSVLDTIFSTSLLMRTVFSMTFLNFL